ncbi:hypothetical protein [Wenzhou gastropodes virus 2]|uniref:hypothetical protein n=1 Tax=Wenzhou gastropodes virus 2 TaxID=1923564 RepID=UPI00090A4B50|nr:hypothetical protein [Wenzhou gastropodes virus 2]APG78580.1 hypothetical protein [Wenzhou gastropodes virus 2]APG78590.1 hypothetical protein [Wenzhou gastropodes virus 2]
MCDSFVKNTHRCEEIMLNHENLSTVNTSKMGKRPMKANKKRILEIPITFADPQENVIDQQEEYNFKREEFPLFKEMNRKELRKLKQQSLNKDWKEKVTIKEDRIEKRPLFVPIDLKVPIEIDSYQQWMFEKKKKSKPMKFKNLKEEMKEEKKYKLEEIEKQEKREEFIQDFISQKFKNKVEGFKLLDKKRLSQCIEQAIDGLEQKVYPYKVEEEVQLLYKEKIVKDREKKRLRESQRRERKQNREQMKAELDRQKKDRTRRTIEDFGKFKDAIEKLKDKEDELSMEIIRMFDYYGIRDLFDLKNKIVGQYLSTKDLDKYMNDLAILEFSFELLEQLYGIDYHPKTVLVIKQDEQIAFKVGFMIINGVFGDVEPEQAREIAAGLNKNSCVEGFMRQMMSKIVKSTAEKVHGDWHERECQRKLEKSMRFVLDDMLRDYHRNRWVDVISRYHKLESIYNKKRKDIKPSVEMQLIQKVAKELLVESWVQIRGYNEEIPREIYQYLTLASPEIAIHQPGFPSCNSNNNSLDEVEEETTDQNNSGLIEMVSNIGNTIKSAGKDLYTFIKSWINKIIDMVGSAYRTVMDTVVEKVLQTIVRIIDPFDFLKNKTVDEMRLMVPGILVVIFVIMQILGFVTHSVLMLIINKFCGNSEENFTAQGFDPVSIIMNLFSIIFPSLSDTSFEKLKKTVLVAWGIVAVSTLAGNLSKTLLFLLPVAFKEAVMLRFGTKEQISKFYVDEWIAKATVILKSSKITPVLLDSKFKLKLAEICEQGLILSKECARKHKALVTGMFMKLLQLQSTIEQSTLATGDRDCPWYFHISGVPGVGKNLVIDNIVSRVSGVSDIYYRPINGEYWSGFVNQKAIIIDEFLIGKEDIEEKAKELLGLVSNGQFIPEMASVDNPLIGMKGTVAAPKIVATMNNTPWYSVDGVSDDALLRRRNVNVRMVLNRDAKLKQGGVGVDVDKYTPEEIEKAVWAHFVFLDPILDRGAVGRPKPHYDLDAAIEIMKADFEQHKKNCEKVNKAFGRNTENANRTTSEMVDQILAEIDGVKDEKSSTIEMIFGKIFGTVDFYSQGKSKKSKRNDEEIFTVLDQLNAPSTSDGTFCKQTNETHQFDLIYGKDHACCPDENKLHRHRCDSINCKNQIAHKHRPDSLDHTNLFCRECMMFKDTEQIENGIDPKTFVYARQKDETRDQYIQRLKRVLEEMTEVGADMIQMHYLELLAGQPISFETAFGFDLGLKFAQGCMLSYLVFRIITWVRNMFRPETPQSEDFFSQSPGGGDKQKPKQQNSKPKSRWTNRRNWNSHSSIKTVHWSFDQKNWNYCVPIDSKHILTFGHFEYEGQTSLFIKRGNSCDTYKINSQSFLDNVDLDICIIKVGGMPDFRNKYVDENDLIDDMVLTVKMLRNEGWSLVRSQIVYNVTYNEPLGKKHLERALIYNLNTQVGDCGAPVVIESPPALSGKIIGIHVAGNQSSTKGMATIVTKQDLNIGLNEEIKIDNDDQFTCQSRIYNKDYLSYEMDQPLVLPNIKDAKRIHINMAKGVGMQSSLKPSLISKHVDWLPKKRPPVLNIKDGRNHDKVDPFLNIIKRAGENKQADIDEAILKICEDEFFHELDQKLIWPFEKRKLTIKESIEGIPGLNPIDLSTSAGFPLCNVSKGKKRFIWTDEMGKYHWDQDFEEMVDRFIIDAENGDTWDHRFLCFLKDELVKPKKVENVKTRGIFCGDVIATVAYRMMYGSLIAAFNSSSSTTPFSMGLNQYSYDFDEIVDYLSQVGNMDKIIAGDYTGFDMHFQGKFQMSAYRIVNKLAIWLKQTLKDGFVKHQTEAPCQVGLYIIYFVYYHFSGCILTAIINCIVNVLYFMYIYYKLGNKQPFFKVIRAKVLGDDHLINKHKSVEFFDGKLLQAALSAYLNQEYTSEDKDSPVLESKPLEKCTYLGAHPCLDKNGKYFGRLKKETIQETVLWTKDNNLSILQVATTMIEHASLWEPEFFNHFQNQIVKAFRNEGIRYEKYEQSSLAYIVKNRCAAFTSQTTLDRLNLNNNSDNEPSDGGLTKFVVDEVEEGSLNCSGYNTTSSFDMKKASQSYGANSMIIRKTIEWNKDHIAGAILSTTDVPFGLFTLGSTNNIQNMLLDRWLYSRFDVQLVFQINGTPFQQGSLVAFFNPLSFSSPSILNWFGFQHVFLNPNRSQTVAMVIPYRHFKSALKFSDWSTSDAKDNTLGSLQIGVLSQLRDPNGEGCTLTVYASMLNEQFYVPRPATVYGKETEKESVDEYEELEYSQMHDFNCNASLNINNNGNSSTKTANNTYNLDVSGVMGNMPIQGTDFGKTNLTNSVPITPTVAVGGSSIGKTGQKQTPFGQLKTKLAQKAVDKVSGVLKLDNPPCVGGAVPTFNQFPSLCKSSGVEPTVGMSLHPQTLYRKHHTLFNQNELQLRFILGKKGILRTTKWTKKILPGELIQNIPLTSVFGMEPNDTEKSNRTNIPFNVALLNEFYFWRAIVCIEIRAIRTSFHSGRLRWSVGYGSSKLMTPDRSQVLNGILDFNGEVDVHEIEIPWNTVYEYLRTFEGDKRSENYSLGCFELSVANKLRCPATVYESVDLIMSVSFKDPKVAVPRAVPFVYYGTSSTTFPSGRYSTTPKLNEEEEDSNNNSNETSDDQIVQFVDPVKAKQDNEGADSHLVTSETPMTYTGMSSIQVGTKFEDSVDTVLDVVRRHSLIDWNSFKDNHTNRHKFICNTESLLSGSGSSNLDKILTLGNQPYNRFQYLYRVWAGTLKYRILCRSSNAVVTFQASDYDLQDKIDFDVSSCLAGVLGQVTSEITIGERKHILHGEYVRSDNLPFTNNIAREQLYQTSEKSGFIDVSIPYRNHRDFSMTFSSNLQQSTSGVLNIVTDSTSSKNLATLYQAAGDDFMYGIFAPPDNCYFAPSTNPRPIKLLKNGCYGGYKYK